VNTVDLRFRNAVADHTPKFDIPTDGERLRCIAALELVPDCKLGSEILASGTASVLALATQQFGARRNIFHWISEQVCCRVPASSTAWRTARPDRGQRWGQLLI